MQDVKDQVRSLRLDSYFDVEAARKLRDDLYSVDLRGTGPKRQNENALLYRPHSGGWLLMVKASSRQYGFVRFDEPIFIFSLSKAVIETDSRAAPEQVRNFLAPYFRTGVSIRVQQGANVAAVWYPRQVGGGIGALIEKTGLTDKNWLASKKSHASVVKNGGMLLKGRYDYLAQGETVMSVSAELGKPPSPHGLPGGMRLKDKGVTLTVACRMVASLDFFRSGSLDESDCEVKFGTEVRVDVNRDRLYFDAAVGVRNVRFANSKAFANGKELKKALGFNPNRNYAVFVEGTLRGGVWRNIFGKKGFDLQQVELQALADKETGWHIGVFGQMDLGDSTRMTAAALLPTNMVGASFGDVALKATLSRVDLDQLVMLPAAIGGPKTYPASWRRNIKAAGLEHFYVKNVSFSFAPNMTDPDLSIDQSGTTATGTLGLFDHTLGSVQFRINDDGTYSDTDVAPFSIGWYSLKNTRLKMFIPSGAKAGNPSRIKKLLNFAGQNLFIFFFDTQMNIDGQPERALVSFSALDAGVGFDANITKDVGMGFNLRLPLAKIADRKAPFAVSGYFHSNRKFGDLVRQIVSRGMTSAAKKVDTSLTDEENAIDKKGAELKAAKSAYEEARHTAEKRVAKIKAPLTKAENYLRKVSDHLDYLRSEGDHWKHKYKHTKWYHVKDRAHDLYEEARYYADWAAYKGTVEAAREVVKALRKSTHFIPVDADPTVVEKFAAYNGARFALAVAKGALIAARKSNDLLAKLPDEIVDRATRDFTISKAGITGTASGENDFDLHLNMAGRALGVAWDVAPKMEIATPSHAADVADANLKALTEALFPVSGTLASSAHSYYHAADYASFPPSTVLAYSWDRIPGQAIDIGAGSGRVYVTNLQGRVFEWQPQARKWRELAHVGNIARVAVAPDGAPVMADRNGDVIHWNAGSKDWQAMHGDAQDVGVGADGTVWVVTKKTSNGNGFSGNNPFLHEVSEADRRMLGPDGAIWRKKPGGKWEHMPGAARRVAVDAKGNAWVTNSLGSIYRWTGKSWQHIPGWAADIGVRDGKVWVIGGNDRIWNFIPGTEKWVRITGAGANVTVDKAGLPWVVSRNGDIWRNDGPK